MTPDEILRALKDLGRIMWWDDRDGKLKCVPAGGLSVELNTAIRQSKTAIAEALATTETYATIWHRWMRCMDVLLEADLRGTDPESPSYIEAFDRTRTLEQKLGILERLRDKELKQATLQVEESAA